MAHKHLKIGNDNIQCKGNVLSTLLSYLKVLFYIHILMKENSFKRNANLSILNFTLKWLRLEVVNHRSFLLEYNPYRSRQVIYPFLIKLSKQVKAKFRSKLSIFKFLWKIETECRYGTKTKSGDKTSNIIESIPVSFNYDKICQ